VVVGGGRVAADGRGGCAASFREALWQRVNGVALTPAAATATDRDVLLSTFARREKKNKYCRQLHMRLLWRNKRFEKPRESRVHKCFMFVFLQDQF
jgi:hypothetical protein